MYFVVDVVGERFTMFVVDQEAIKEALDNMNGLNNMHPTRYSTSTTTDPTNPGIGAINLKRS
jgi:hypothetical protein